MASVDVNINEAAVTAVQEFKSYKGWGIDFFIKVQSSNCTVFLQVVLYDEEARRKSSYIHEGDYVRVTGTLKDKPYQKKDGTAGHSLLIERPIVFDKIIGRNNEQQSQQNPYDGKTLNTNKETNVDTADAVPDGDDFWRIVAETKNKPVISDEEYIY